MSSSSWDAEAIDSFERDILQWKDNEENFISNYKSIHVSPQLFSSFSKNLRLWCHNNSDFEFQTQVFTMIRRSEEELHNSPSDIYHCILLNYGGDETVTERICYPKGTVIDKIKLKIKKIFYPTASRPLIIPWHFFDITLGLLCLCSHLLDYVKDIDLTISLHHFDTQVIQKAYIQYDDFNLSYLTYTSIALMIISHFVIAIYWATISNRPNVTGTSGTSEGAFWKSVKNHIPYIPTLLPILLFCRHTKLNLIFIKLVCLWVFLRWKY